MAHWRVKFAPTSPTDSEGFATIIATAVDARHGMLCSERDRQPMLGPVR